jgi:uncharacterized membrane protein YhaH (DUF805 family)
MEISVMERDIWILVGIGLLVLMVAIATRRDPSKRWWWWLGALIGGSPQFDDEKDKSKGKIPPVK